MRISLHSQHSKKTGFTLIELMVSLGLFTVVSLMGISAVLVVIASNKRTLSANSVLSNLDLAIEDMSRSIRVGSFYSCGSYTPGLPPQTPNDCAPGSGGASDGQNNFTFKPDLTTSDTDRDTYYLSGTGASAHIVKAVNGVDEGAITPPEVTITSLIFFVQGSVHQNDSVGSRTQPKVIIIIAGYVTNGTAMTPFNIQTTVSQRLVL